MSYVRRYDIEIASAFFIIAHLMLLLFFIFPRMSSWIAVRGLYPVIGVLVGYAVYYHNATERESPTSHQLTTAQLEKISVIVILLYMTVLVTFRFRWLSLIVPLIIITYALVRAAAENEFRRALHLVVLAFVLPPVTKVVANDYYFGGPDMIKDFAEAELFVRSDSIAALPGWYQSFPVTYLLNGSVAEVSSLSVYYSYHATGIVIFSTVPVIFFYLLKRYSRTRTAIAGSFTAVVLYPFSYFSTHLNPPPVSAVIFLFVLYFSSKSTEGRHWLLLVLGALFTLVLNHHLSIIFVLCILFVYEFARFAPVQSADKLNFPPAYVTRFLTLIATAYLIYTTDGSRFIAAVVTAALDILSPAGESASTTVINFSGVDVFYLAPSYNILDSVVWLVTPEGLVNILYVAVILLSSIWLYRHANRRLLVLAVPGLFSSLLLIKTPFSFPGIFRARLFGSIAAVFYLMFGVRYLIDNVRTSGTVSLSLVILLVLAVVAPLSASDDINELRPDAEEIRESSFSDAEVRGMDSSARFVQSYVDRETATYHFTRAYLNQWHPMLTIETLDLLSSWECGEPYLLYRLSWTNNVLIYVGGSKGEAGRGQQYVTNDSRMSTMLNSSYKIFTNGRNGIVRENCSVR